MTVRALPALAALLVAACSAPSPEDKKALDQPQVEAAPASAPARLMAASDYVKTFYAADPAWGTDEEVRRLFAPDLAEAILKDRKAHEGEVPSIDFAFQCGCQDGRVTDVNTTQTDTATGADVTASFLIEGKPRRIDYRLLSSESGWRLADVSAPAQDGDESWSLRALVGLKPL